MTVRNVLVSVDGSSASTGAVRAAIELVAPDGMLHLVRVVPTSPLRRAVDYLVHFGLEEAFRARNEVRAEWSLGELSAAVRSLTSAEVRVAVKHGNVRDELLAYGAREGVDLLVLGDARPRGVVRRLGGGLAPGLVERSPVPTLVVPDGVSLTRVRHALVVARELPSSAALKPAGDALANLSRTGYAFMATGPGPDRGLGGQLARIPPSTVLVIPRASDGALEPGWVLNQSECPVLFVPLATESFLDRDTVKAYAAWHGGVRVGV